MEQKERETCSIDEWEREFAEIYGEVDVQRSPAEIWLLLVEDASKVAECIRREVYGAALDRLAHVVCWTLSFVWRCRRTSNLPIQIRNRMSEIVWHKYPWLCSKCHQPRCVCSVRQREREEMTELEQAQLDEREVVTVADHRQDMKRMPKTLDQLTEMFHSIYRGAHYFLPIEAIAFHFLEEVGEVAESIRRLRERYGGGPAEVDAVLQQHLEDEIADIVSWTMSLLTKLDYLLGAGACYVKQITDPRCQTVGLRLSHEVWRAFERPDGKSLYCPRCRHRPCQCTRVPIV